MILITVARKPLSGTVVENATVYGVGGINIDSCRIGVDPGYKCNNDRNKTIWHGETGERTPRSAEKGGADFTESSAGRWPSNLILVHMAGCVHAGTKIVRSDGHYPSTRGVGGLSTSGHMGQFDLVEKSMDGEIIDAWNCEHGCPVAAMDRQSGVITSGKMKAGQKRMASKGDGGFHGNFPDTATVDGTYGDSGGASRFFKQIAHCRQP